MPRQSRIKSESGIYHIMLRGINRQSIFETEEDYDKLVKIFKMYQYKLKMRILIVKKIMIYVLNIIKMILD